MGWSGTSNALIALTRCRFRRNRNYLDWSTDQSGDYVWREETFGTVEGEGLQEDDQNLL